MSYQSNVPYYMVSHAGAGIYLSTSGSNNVCLSSAKEQSWRIVTFDAGDKIVSNLNQAFALNYPSANSGNASICDIVAHFGNDAHTCVTLTAVNAPSNIYKIKLKNYNLYLTATGIKDGDYVRWEPPVSSGSTQQWRFLDSQSGGDDDLGQAITDDSQYSSLSELDLIARCIYSEAGNQGDIGRRGVACVLRNRKGHQRFPNSYRDIILQKNQFSGMQSSYAMRPDTTSANWIASVAVAKQINTVANPIGTCTFFWRNDIYSNNIVSSGPPEVIYFSKTNVAVLEKIIIGNHTFFRVEGY